MKRNEDVKNLQVRSKIVQNTLKTKIYQRLVPSVDKSGNATNDVGQGQGQGKGKGQAGQGQDWGDLLEDFFVAAKQLDDLQHEMKAVYSINIPVPRRERPPGGEFPFSIPQLLSPAYPKEDSDILVQNPDANTADAAAAAAYFTPASLLHVERHLILDHNSRMDRVLESFNLSVDEWRQNAKAKGSKKSAAAAGVAAAASRNDLGLPGSTLSPPVQPVKPVHVPMDIAGRVDDKNAGAARTNSGAAQQKRKRDT